MKQAGMWLVLLAVVLVVFDFNWLDPTKQFLAMEKEGIVHVQLPPGQVVDGDLELRQWLNRRMAWFPVQAGMRLDAGIRIKTLADAHLTLLLADKIACRVMPESIIQLMANEGEPQGLFPWIEQGSLFCRIHGLESVSLADAIAIRVETPLGRMDTVHGAFLATYSPSWGVRVEVLDGSVQFKAVRGQHRSLAVSAGQGLQALNTSLASPLIAPLLMDRKMALTKMNLLRLIPSFWSQIMEHWPLSVNLLTRYHDLLAGSTVRSMQEVRKGITVAAPFRWENQTPVKLNVSGVEDDSLRDAWGNLYYYEKLGVKQAVLVAFGRDGLLFTHDDIVLKIRL